MPAAEGTVRFNTTTHVVELYNGSGWVVVGSNVTNQVLYGDNSTAVFTLNINSGDTSFSITDDQAYQLAIDGTLFAPEDDVEVTTDLDNPRLRTSLQDLQKLNVDAVLLSGDANSVTVDLGSGTLDSQLNGEGLPTFTHVFNERGAWTDGVEYLKGLAQHKVGLQLLEDLLKERKYVV
jgi:hypothetical protein